MAAKLKPSEVIVAPGRSFEELIEAEYQEWKPNGEFNSPADTLVEQFLLRARNLVRTADRTLAAAKSGNDVIERQNAELTKMVRELGFRG